MSLFVVDVEADGPAPGLYSMISFGAVVVDPELDQYFYGRTSPISSDWQTAAQAVSGVSREDHMKFPLPEITMQRFQAWVEAANRGGRPVFISDNLAFDWQWINYYFHRFTGKNPFGYSGRRIGDLYAGMQGDFTKANEWKRLRRTKHTHYPVDDARGNAEALLQFNLEGLRT